MTMRRFNLTPYDREHCTAWVDVVWLLVFVADGRFSASQMFESRGAMSPPTKAYVSIDWTYPVAE